MNFTKRLFTITIVFTFSFNVFAYNLKQITNNYNLSNSSITDICQDEKGTIYIGTCDGLNIYNGRDVETFESENENNFITGNIIDKIIYTGDNTFWIQTYYGLNRFNANTKTITHFNEFQKLFFINKDKNNNLYIINESNSIFYNQKKNPGFKKILTSGFIFTDIKKFFIDNNNIMWIITNKGYYITYKITEKDNEISLTPINNKLKPTGKIIDCFYEDNTLYYITENFDMFLFDTSNGYNEFIINLKNEITNRGKVSSIIKHHNSYFIGFQTNGLIQLIKQEKSYSIKEIEVNSGIFCLKKDKLQDILWIGTDGKGVYLYSNTAYSIKSYLLNNIPTKIERPVRALYLDKENSLWIGSKGDGILKFENYNINTGISNCPVKLYNKSNSSISDNIIYAFEGSKRNIVWIGNENGLNYYSYRSKKIKQINIKIKGVDFKYIHDIYETADSKLWLASVGMGILCADITGSNDEPMLTNFKHYTINNGDFESNYFFSIFKKADNSIWFANRGYGPFYLNAKNNNLEPVNFYNKYSNQTINDVFVIQNDNKGNMLFGTGYGLVKYTNPNTHKLFNSRNGFLNNSIHAIEKENDHVFWLSTNKGIIQFNSNSEGFRIFDKTDGLKITEFSDGASFRDNNGNIYFGGINGFISIQKDNGKEQAYMPEINFDKLSIFGKKENISENISTRNGKKKLELKYKQNFFSISFIAIDYVNGGNYTYYYKMEGLSDQWINNGTSNTASFTNISPGNYTLKVKYFNRTLEKMSNEYTLKIRIIPPWYLSWPAYFVYFIFFLLIIYQTTRFFISKQKREKKSLLDELEKKHQKEVFESKLRFFTNIAHEFCTPLTLISGPCERIMSQEGVTKFTKNYIQMIQTNANRLNNLIQELIEFRRIETGNRELVIESLAINDIINKTLNMFTTMAESNNIEVDFSSHTNILWNSDRGFFTTIITNLISNAFKYTKNDKKIIINTTISSEILTISISNQGNKINNIDALRVFDRYTILDNFENQENKQKFSRNGLGLAISYNMVKLLNGNIDVTTADDFVTFIINLPMIQLSPSITSNKANSSYTYTPELKQHNILSLPKYEYNKLKQSILIIDDDVEILMLIGELFSNDFNIFTLSNPKNLDSIFEKTYPNLIICDIKMTDIDGIQVIKTVKSKKETAHIPIIIISGNYDLETKIEAIEAGADVYINKPFNTKYLRTIVFQNIERNEKLKDYFSSSISSYELLDGKITHTEHKKFLQELVKIINDNLTSSELTTQFIADKLGIGSRSLYRKMKEIGIESLSHLIKENRLIYASELLIKTKLTIDEVVYKSGFSNKVTFFKAFQKKYSCTPKEYRTKNDTY